MTQTWVACEMKTGRVITDLPFFSCADVAETICGYTTTKGTLPAPTAPEDWERATLPGGAYLVLLDDGRPIWGGFVTSRTRSLGNTIILTLATIAAYFDRRYMSAATLVFTATDQGEIVETLVDTFVGDAIPIRVERQASIILRNRTYEGELDKTILSLLTELSGVIDGPEWCIGWESGESSGQVTFTPVLFVADQLGSYPNPGLAPNVVLCTGGNGPFSLQSAEFVEDFSSSAGANDVMATSTPDGDVRPESPHQVFVDASRPVYEFRFSPTSAIDDVDGDLTEHAEAALSRMKNGSQSLVLSIRYDTDAPMIDADISLGDLIGVQIAGGPVGSEDVLPQFPDGLAAYGRMTGWTLRLGDSPILEPILEELVVI